MGYAVVLGEALVDLLDAECDGQPVYRQAIGGGPLNVAVAVARLGGDVQFVGSLGDDALAERIRAFLSAAGVGLAGAVTVPAPTALAVATFAGPEPDFRFYGEPRSYALLGPDDLDVALVEGADVLYCGSIVLLDPPVLAAARRAWSIAGALRVFDPNVRPRLLGGPGALAGLREVVAEFAAGAHLVKLSSADARLLYPDEPVEGVAAYLRELGAGTVVVTLGADGALVAAAEDVVRIPAPKVAAADATGAGDSVMGALIAELLTAGEPVDPTGWQERVAFALRVAGLVCEFPGGATAMPTRAAVTARFPT
ncbi:MULTISPECIES: PfkB family carbohydrate kinase [Micromonospora]|uniref:Carbohydrate kinase n=1 Tax=Micromonospora solifontis TaxID=2487138 RepID=A0ABX9W999_9ACTN|nr:MULTISPECIES: PfkB family carbohydrate kinase [Micromonospora]NES15047.1 carbohydrate kinase [Micromonospora sp. PPF5-17B]NES39386.1 carbohydrate kinase [Micromonospora solifontis]NES57572.1 carbohydrate kinase [Micromonospora sp. PPF5-6]RNL89136.1 carbohydrate kinase [Micromonospora solifontis]